MSATLAPAAAARRPAAAGAAPRLAFALALALLVALQFGPAIGLIGFRLTQQPGWALLGLARDGLALALLCAGLWAVLTARRTTTLPSSARWALVMAAVYALLALGSPAELSTVALNLRRLLLVPLLFVALLLLPWTPAQLRALMRALLASSVLVALFGVAELLAPEALWTEWLQVVQFFAANPLDPFGALAFHDSGRFFTWDLERWTDAPVRRAVATYLEPTTLAAAMAAGLMAVLAGTAQRGSIRWTWRAGLLLLCGLLTLSKSFWLFLPLLAAWRWFGVPSPRQVFGFALAAVAVALLVDLGGLQWGGLAHVGGLASGVRHLFDGNWLGEGIGAAGNYAGDEIDIGTESGLGNVLAQVGIAGLLTLAWVRSVAADVLRATAARRDTGGHWLAAWLLFWLLSFLFSASSLGVGGNALGFMMLALYLHPAWCPSPVPDHGAR